MVTSSPSLDSWFSTEEKSWFTDTTEVVNHYPGIIIHVAMSAVNEITRRKSGVVANVINNFSTMTYFAVGAYAIKELMNTNEPVGDQLFKLGLAGFAAYQVYRNRSTGPALQVNKEVEPGKSEIQSVTEQPEFDLIDQKLDIIQSEMQKLQNMLEEDKSKEEEAKTKEIIVRHISDQDLPSPGNSSDSLNLPKKVNLPVLSLTGEPSGEHVINVTPPLKRANSSRTNAESVALAKAMQTIEMLQKKVQSMLDLGPVLAKTRAQNVALKQQLEKLQETNELKRPDSEVLNVQQKKDLEFKTKQLSQLSNQFHSAESQIKALKSQLEEKKRECNSHYGQLLEERAKNENLEKKLDKLLKGMEVNVKLNYSQKNGRIVASGASTPV